MRALPPDRLEEGRYENGWNGRQILAHIASIEWTNPRLIDIARAPGRWPTRRPPRGPCKAVTSAYNERQVSRRAHLSVADLVGEFERNRATTIQAVEAADELLFGRRIRSAGGVVGPLATAVSTRSPSCTCSLTPVTSRGERASAGDAVAISS